MADNAAWPELPLGAWADTRTTLHMYTQIMGKIRLALTPREPQWANVPLVITALGLGTGAMQCMAGVHRSRWCRHCASLISTNG